MNLRRGLSVIDRQPQQEDTPEEVATVETGRPLISGNAPWWRPLFAAITVALVIGAAVRYEDISHIAVVAVYIAVFVACAATDLTSYRVPNVITYPAILFAFLVGACDQGQLTFYGHSRIIGPLGNVVADTGEEEGLATAAVPSDSLRRRQWGSLNVFRDRRPETYTTIASEEIYHTPSATGAETAHQTSRRRHPQRGGRGRRR